MKTTGGTQAQCCNKSWIFKLIGLRQNYRLAQPTSTRCRRRNMPRRHGYPLFRQPPPSCWSPKNQAKFRPSLCLHRDTKRSAATLFIHRYKYLGLGAPKMAGKGLLIKSIAESFKRQGLRKLLKSVVCVFWGGQGGGCRI